MPDDIIVSVQVLEPAIVSLEVDDAPVLAPVVAGGQGPQGEPGPVGAASNLKRMYGPPTATSIPSGGWTLIPLTGGFFLHGEDLWEPVTSGPHAGGVQCLRDGIYALIGSVIFDESNQSGTRGVWVTDLQTTETWDLINSTSATKAIPTPVQVGGQAYLEEGAIIGLQAYSSINTATTDNPLSEWMSATLIP